MTLYLLNYNSYFNRIVKLEQSLADYQKYLCKFGVLDTDEFGNSNIVKNVNFDPKDGINTQFFVNWNGNSPDYVLVVNDSNEIVSRWYVLDAAYVRGGQLQLTLYRDLPADFYKDLKTSTFFIEKGYVPQDSPLIFSSENMGFNQIKTSETVLKNDLQTPWLVLYLSRLHTKKDSNGNDTDEKEYNKFSATFKDVGAVEPDPGEMYNSISDYPFAKWCTGISGAGGEKYKYIVDSSIDYRLAWQYQSASSTSWLGMWLYVENDGLRGVYLDSGHAPGFTFSTGQKGTVYPRTVERGNSGWYKTIDGAKAYQQLHTGYHKYDTTVNGLPYNTLGKVGTQEGFERITQENGKTIRIGNTLYNVLVHADNADYEFDHSVKLTPTNAGEMYQTAYDFLKSQPALVFDQIYYGADDRVRAEVSFPYTNPTVYIELVEAGVAPDLQAGYFYNINYEKGAVTVDSVYEIIATPLNNVTFTDEKGVPWTHSGRLALQWFQDIINRYNGAGAAYDLQLVPYINFDRKQLPSENVTFLTPASDKYGSTRLAVAFKLSSCSFSFSKPLNFPVRANKKIASQVDLYRFVSPNGVGEYEFSPAKNNGLSGYEVNCTLIPFNPYIRVTPIFNGLYGKNFKDYRGLICGGDFSMPILKDDWATYQLQNKYYQDIFARQIQSQEYQNSWALAGDIAGAVAGTGGGAAAGAAAGTMVMPGIGTAVGAIVGGIAGAIGGTVDVISQNAIRKEQIQLAKDTFDMQLGTIKARPNSLTRTTAYNIDNKYFPYIEYYTCSDIEIEALENKIKYKGMTVGVIGKLFDWVNKDIDDYTYVQAIGVELTVKDDFHLASQLDAELRLGIRIKEY